MISSSTAPSHPFFSQLVNRFPGMACHMVEGEGRPVFRVSRRAGQPDLEISEEQMGLFLIHLLETVSVPLDALAAMAGLVFQAPVVLDNIQGNCGIWVEHGMGRFVCGHCGHCCRDLAYTHDCTETDVRRWQEAGRQDVLDRVRQTKEGSFEIWVDPDTGGFHDTCPWLAIPPDTRTCLCSIYQIRPDTCRQYPLTPKHAAMTGCPGNFSGPGI